ncbi:hypothetical protein KW830_05545 [Comamonas sp. CMM03]|nr:hypothetical protein [Comamonas sp. CMM03]
MPLELVPPTPPDRLTAMVERIKAIARPDGALMCNKCGGLDTMIIRNGDRIVGGRIKPGTVTDHGVCPHCWKRGIYSNMIPDRPKVVKEPKPRRIKPKVVK